MRAPYVSAEEVVLLGFVNEVVQGDVVAAARRWADDILAWSPMTIRATKEAVLRNLNEGTESFLERQSALPATAAMLASQDAVVRLDAFAVKLAPAWSGR